MDATIAALILLASSNTIQPPSPTFDNGAPQVCNVQFVNVEKGESPWLKMEDFPRQLLNEKDPEVVSKIRDYINNQKDESQCEVIHDRSFLLKAHKIELPKIWSSFTTVRMSTGEPVTRYSAKWVNASQGNMRIESCKLKLQGADHD